MSTEKQRALPAGIALAVLALLGVLFLFVHNAPEQEPKTAAGPSFPAPSAASSGMLARRDADPATSRRTNSGNPPQISKEERKRIGQEITERVKYFHSPTYGDRYKTVEAIRDGWQSTLAVYDEFMEKYPDCAEMFLHGRINADGTALSLLRRLDRQRSNPVQLQEIYDSEHDLAIIYIRHIDEYLAVATDETSIRFAQFAKVDLLEKYTITDQPSSKMSTKAGESFENAYDSGLREGKCLLRTATFAAQSYSEGYDYIKAIKILERAKADAKSGKYEVHGQELISFWGFLPGSETINSLIAEYRKALPNAEKERADSLRFDAFMKEMDAENRAYVEEYRKKIERGEVPAEGLPEKSEQPAAEPVDADAIPAPDAAQLP